MKNYTDFIGHIKFWITNAMCCTSIFFCIMTMISNFPIIYTIGEPFLRFFFHNCNILLNLDVILVLLLLVVIFFSFRGQFYFLHVLLKIRKTFSYSIFHEIKYVCFLCDQMPKILTLNIYRKYAHLFLLLKNFLDYLHIHLFFLN